MAVPPRGSKEDWEAAGARAAFVHIPQLLLGIGRGHRVQQGDVQEQDTCPGSLANSFSGCKLLKRKECGGE